VEVKLGGVSPSSSQGVVIPPGYIPSPQSHSDHHDHGSHSHSEGGSLQMDASDAFSSVGLALVLGFIFMLLVDQCSRSRGSSRDVESPSSYHPSKRSFTATLGLVVHAAG